MSSLPTALTCPRCGAPLPSSSHAERTCAYCLAAVRVDGTVSVTEVAASQTTAVGATPAGAAFCQALAEALQRGGDPYDAIRTLAAKHLGVLGESDALARVSLAIADDFATESGASIRKDGVAMSRIAGGYLLAIAAIRESGTYQLDLSFLAATTTGPKHLVRTLDGAIIASLAARDPRAAPPAGKKKWFWQ